MSPELAQITCSYPPEKEKMLDVLLGSLADRRINILFLGHEIASSLITTTICVEQENQLALHSGFQAIATDENDMFCRNSVGTLTVFPHRSSVAFLGRILKCFYSNGLPVYGFCTSISALSVITDYAELDSAAEHLLKIVELPENHAPFRQEICVRQLEQG